jgi:chromosome segregation ATPase
MILIDIIVIALLIITIAYCFRLNKKIVELHNGRAELAQLLKQFDNTIVKANDGIKEIRETSRSSSLSLDTKVSLAEARLKQIDEAIEFVHDNISKAATSVSMLESVIVKAQKVYSNINQAANNLANINYARTSNIPQQPEVIKNIMHQNKVTPVNGGIENLAVKTFKAPNIAPVENKREAIESLLERISEIQKRKKHGN